MEKSGVEARFEVEEKSKIYRISCASGSTAVLQAAQAAAQSMCRAQRCSDLHISAGDGHELGLFTCSLQCSTKYTLLLAGKKAYSTVQANPSRLDHPRKAITAFCDDVLFVLYLLISGPLQGSSAVTLPLRASTFKDGDASLYSLAWRQRGSRESFAFDYDPTT